MAFESAASPALAIVVSAAALATACRGATEITLELRTDLDCRTVASTTVTIGSPSGIPVVPTTTSTACTAGDLGTLVVVPSGVKTDAVAIRATARVDGPGDCSVPDAKCVVALRELRFVPHENLRLPVVLQRACLGVLCPADHTCADGRCIDARCASSGCDIATELDAGAVVADASDSESALPSCAADLSSDSRNCGQCGHDCLGAACAQGMCASTAIATVQGTVGMLAADGVDVFWSEPGVPLQADGSLKKVARAGGQTIVLAASRESPAYFALDATTVFWVEGLINAVMRTPKAQGALTPVATGPSGTEFDRIGTDDTYLYVDAQRQSGGSSLFVFAKTGATPSDAFSSNLGHPESLAVIPGTAFWLESPNGGGQGNVRRFDRESAVSQVLATFTAAAGGNVLAASTRLVAWGDGQNVRRRTSDGAISTLVTAPAPVAAVAVDGDTVYAVASTSGSHVIQKLAPGRAALTLAVGAAGAALLAFDDAYVYWLAGPSPYQIRAVPK